MTTAATDATAAATTTAATTGSTASQSTGTSALGENDFLQLMMEQLKDQNPLDPSDPTQYLSELAQFTSLEQQTNIATADSALASEQNASTAIALIGHTVTYTNSSNEQETGQVQSVQLDSSGTPSLTVSGVAGVALGSVSEVS